MRTELPVNEAPPLNGAVASEYVLNTYEALVKLGCPPMALLEIIPGGDKALRNPSHRFAFTVMLDMLHRAEALSDIVGINVLAGDHPRLSALSELGYAMVASSTLEDMIGLYSAYQPLLQEACITDVTKNEDTASVTLDSRQPCDPNYLRPYVERFFGAVATFGRWVTWDQSLALSSVSFQCDAPANLSAHEKIFACPIYFNAPRNEVKVPRSLIEAPMPQPNPALVESISERLDLAMASLGAPLTTSAETFTLLKAMLAEGAPSLAKVTYAMGTTERTLRRRLKEEDTTYSAVLEAARKDECELMISRGVTSPAVLSAGLGYSESSAFTRAFKGWYGVPPSEYLRKQA